MSLIDPTTPEGFFHMRLAPLKQRLSGEGAGFFATAPEPGQSSYFESPPAGPGCGPAPADAQAAVEALLRLWRDDPRHADLLGRMEDDLRGLLAIVIAERSAVEGDGGNEEVSDYIYPIS